MWRRKANGHHTIHDAGFWKNVISIRFPGPLLNAINTEHE